MRPLSLALVFTACLAAGALAQARKPAPKKPVPRPAPGAAYIITTSAQDQESLQVEGRLAVFIRSLQQGRRQKAASLLSSRVTPQAREDLIAKRWLPARVGPQEGFGQIFFWRDIQIYTYAIARTGDRRSLLVGPRKILFAPGRKKRPGTGVVEVPMVKERGDWWVDLRPPG
jgi:hypothetical protein